MVANLASQFFFSGFSVHKNLAVNSAFGGSTLAEERVLFFFQQVEQWVPCLVSLQLALIPTLLALKHQLFSLLQKR